MKCSDHACDRDAKLRGFCTKHYHIWRTGPDFVRRVTPTPGRCSFPGCTNTEKAGGVCNTHYQRVRRERLRVACIPTRKLHEYSTKGRCIHCGTKQTRKYVSAAKKLP